MKRRVGPLEPQRKPGRDNARKITSVQLSSDLLRAIDRIAHEQDRSRSWMIEHLLRAALENVEGLTKTEKWGGR